MKQKKQAGTEFHCTAEGSAIFTIICPETIDNSADIYRFAEGNDMDSMFKELFDTIDDRKGKAPSESYVASLMSKGTVKINSKITEEAAEVCEAALEEDKDHLLYEICDLLFHTFVLAGYKGITIEEIETELRRRHGMSGLAEKASRGAK
jgi:phosphoribosyl-ATP pyrophosphohydrolase